MAAAEAGKAKALRVLLGSGDCGVNAKDLVRLVAASATAARQGRPALAVTQTGLPVLSGCPCGGKMAPTARRGNGNSCRAGAPREPCVTERLPSAVHRSCRRSMVERR